MSRFSSAILLLVYSITLLTVPVSARPYAYIVTTTENTEKEAVTGNTFEHRESSSIRVTGKLCKSYKLQLHADQQHSDIYYTQTLPEPYNRNTVPIYIMHCVYRL